MPDTHRKNRLTELTLAAFFLLIVHILWKQTFYYTFLPWNLLLAWIPLLLARLFVQCLETRRRAMATVWFLLWLFFFPNGPYILTDYIHVFNPSLYFELSGLEPYYDFGTFSKPAFETIFEFSLVTIVVMIALTFAYESIAIVFDGLKKKKHRLQAWHVTVPVGVLTGIAVYIGRVMRFNSWDAVIRPHVLLAEIWTQILNGVLLQPVFLVCFLGSIIVVSVGYVIQQKFFRMPL
ncbi:MAG TPA: DUF1361 domain-containing protein [Candidatus Gracilibacteria bacterium]|nr:DUF1361 domain-containing protein [Candidatus Gracilibacteria bacterium]